MHTQHSLLALFYLSAWRGLLPCPEVLAVNVLLRSAQLVHKVLVIDEPDLEIQSARHRLGLSEQGAATLLRSMRREEPRESAMLCT